MTDALTADQIDATDDTMSAPVDLHPTLPTVAEALLTQDCDRKLSQWHASRPGAILHASEAAEAVMKANWLKRDIAGIQRRMEERRQQQLRAALDSLRALKEPQ